MRQPEHRLGLYWHAGHSLGHTVRNAVLARAFLDADPAASVMALTRSRYGFEYLPDAVDVVKLPELDARQPPERMARRVRGALSELDPARMARLRAALVDAFMAAYEPTAFVVDYHPLGKDGDLEDALRARRDCTWVLGLRGFIQSPQRSALSHFGAEAAAAISELYSTIWVYADRRVVDLEAIYEIPEPLASMLTYTGYVTRAARAGARPPEADDLHRPLIVVSFGGGKRMDRLVEAAVAAALDGTGGAVVVFAGPWADARDVAALERSAAGSGRLLVKRGSRQLDAWLRAADLFIGKGGYNTLAEILATRCNAVIVRDGPATVEQSWHAERLAQAGLVGLVDAEEIEAGGRGAAAVVARALGDPYPQSSWSPAVDGGETCARILGGMPTEPTGA